MPAAGKDAIPHWEQLFGTVVVIDLASPFVFVGRLVAQQGEYLLLADADAHDLRDAPVNRERYVLQCRSDGVRANRKFAWVRTAEIVCVSRLEDVVPF